MNQYVKKEQSSMLNDYERQKLDKLESFERKVKSVTESIGHAINWIWVIIGIGIPVFVWLRPLPEISALQAIIFTLLIWFLFALSKASKHIAKLGD